MDLGIPVPNITPPTGREGIVEIARAADGLGFHSLWLGDHIATPILPSGEPANRYSWDLYDPFVSAGLVAGITTRAKIAFGVIVLPYRNPIVTAKMVATLDQLSAGRVILGIGPGYLQGEFAALGIPYRDTGRKTDEYLRAFRALWASETPVFEGEFVRIRDVLFKPPPVQDPLPIWIGGFSEAAMRRAARLGNGWHVPRFDVPTLRPILDRFHEICREEGRSLDDLVISNRPTVRFAPEPSTEFRHAHGAHIVGPPDYVAEELARFETELGVQHLTLDIHEGDPVPDLIAALETLATRVVPQLPRTTR